jgi:hypothetical protein
LIGMLDGFLCFLLSLKCLPWCIPCLHQTALWMSRRWHSWHTLSFCSPIPLSFPFEVCQTICILSLWTICLIFKTGKPLTTLQCNWKTSIICMQSFISPFPELQVWSSNATDDTLLWEKTHKPVQKYWVFFFALELEIHNFHLPHPGGC